VGGERAPLLEPDDRSLVDRGQPGSKGQSTSGSLRVQVEDPVVRAAMREQVEGFTVEAAVPN
jgi:hypothetical protein